MKLVSIDDYQPAVLVAGGIVNLSNVIGGGIMGLPPHCRMPALIERWNDLQDEVTAVAERTPPNPSYILRAPIPRPGKMLFAASNYREGLMNGIPTPLDMFVKLPSTIIDPGQPVKLPPQDAQLFFHEAELGVVIGKTARNVSRENAMSHVFGYCCVNDVSCWGLHGSSGGLHNKNFDTFLGFGPCIVTRDQIPDPHSLDVKLWVDGELRQDYNTSDMEHPIPAIIEWASRIATLEPGDLLACGTNHRGIGPIQHGDVMKVVIPEVGELVNPVHDDRKRRWLRGPDRQFENWMHSYKLHGKGEGDFFSVHPLG